MLTVKICIVLTAIVLQSSVKSLILSVRGWSLTRPADVRQSRQIYSSSSDDELKNLYEKAQLEDAEWLERVFGVSTNSSQGVTVDKIDNIDNLDTVKDSVSAVQQLSSKVSRESINTDKLSELLYSTADIAAIKDSVLRVILEKSVSRPRKGLPPSWVKGSVESGSDGYTPTSRSITDSDSRSKTSVENKESFVRGENRFENDETEPLPRKSRVRGENDVSEVRSRVSFKGIEPTEEDDNKERIGRTRSARDEVSEGRMQSRRSSDVSEKAKSDQIDWDDEKDRDGPSPFWPDNEEFKDMLLDESQWRADLIGDWCVPFIRAETKWRYNLYKGWLQFLDEGIGDGFDVMSEEFGEDYDREAEEMDDYEEYFERGNSYSRDGPKSSSSGNDVSRDIPFEGNSDSDETEGSDLDVESEKLEPRKTKERNSKDRQESYPRKSTKADKYNAYMEEKVGTTEWTQLAGEQRLISKELKKAAAPIRREDQFRRDSEYWDEDGEDGEDGDERRKLDNNRQRRKSDNY